MALSSSAAPPGHSHAHIIKPKLRHKKGEVRAPPTLLTSSSPLKNEIIATRFEEMFTCQETRAGVVGVAKDDVTIVPTTDQLSLHCPVDRLQESNEFSSYKTLWVLSASGPEEPCSVFNVPGLKDLIEGNKVSHG